MLVNRFDLTKNMLTWVAPAAGIPALRYFQDDKNHRNELFVRDASTYMLGAFLFLGFYHGGKSLLDRLSKGGKGVFERPLIKMSEQAKDFTAFLTALTANILYAGFGAVWLSRRYKASRIQPAEETTVSGLRRPAPAYFPSRPNTMSYWA